MTFIPISNPGLSFAKQRDEILQMVQVVMDSGHYILGEQVVRFESEFADYLGVSQCVGVGNGTDAITMALMAFGIGEGDEVITPALTAHGNAVGICRSGATPVFADVTPDTRCLDPEAVERVIGPNTAALLVVHLHGHPAEMTRLREIADCHNLVIVEDAAQAHGAMIGERRVGSFGDAAVFSFYPTKNLGCLGDGGAVATSNAALAERLKSLRNYGWCANRISCEQGLNSRLDEIQAAILRVLLPKLDEQNQQRRTIAAEYYPELAGLPWQLPPVHDGAIYHQFCIALEFRDAFRDWMAQGGIGTDVHYPVGLHQMPAFPNANLPITDDLCNRLVSLPIQPGIADVEFERIVERMKAWG